jgi:hypothetical protein
MELQALKASLNNVLPILNANLGAAYNEYMDSTIPAGAYGYVRSRHETALAVISRDDIEPEQAYKACAALTLDLTSGITLMDDAADAEAKLQGWWKCYRDAGFTDIHSFLKIPVQPDGAVRG